MSKSFKWLLAAAIGLAIAILATASASAAHPDLTEHWYSRTIYPATARVFAHFAELTDCSLAEVMVPASTALLFAIPLLSSACFWKGGIPLGKALAKGAIVGMTYASFALASLMSVYGFNFFRAPTAAIFGLDPAIDTSSALNLAVAETNALAARINDGPATEGSLANLERELIPFQTRVLRAYGLPPLEFGRTKPFFASRSWLALGIGGFYWPLTGEANVAATLAPFIRPFAIAHERAHLSGFATEATADFIAMLTVWQAPEPEIAYAGWLIFWLRGFDQGVTGEGLSERVKADVAAIVAFAANARGRGADAMTATRNASMHAVGQSDGVKAYNGSFDFAVLYLAKKGIGLEEIRRAN